MHLRIPNPVPGPMAPVHFVYKTNGISMISNFFYSTAPMGITVLFQECVHWLQNIWISNGISKFCIKSFKNIRFYKQSQLVLQRVRTLIAKHMNFQWNINILHQNVNITLVSLMFSILWNTRLLFLVFKTFIFQKECSLFCVWNASKHHKTIIKPMVLLLF